MKDLKQIQEFFSKPLEENVDKKYSDFLVALRDSGVTNMFGAGPYLQAEFGLDKREAREILANWMRSFGESLSEGKQLDIEDFAKVVKAVEQTGHPVTVLLVPKFNEIEVITGMNAPDDMLFDLSNAVDSLGYGRNDIFIAGDSSNLSRREYSDIRRVNGGAKDYFEESLDEAKRPEPNYKELVKLLIMAFKHEPKSRFYFNRNNGVVYFDLIGGAAYSPKKSKMRDIFGGMNPIAVNREFGRADHHEEETIKQVEQLSKGKIKAEIKELGNGVLYKLAAVNENSRFEKRLAKMAADEKEKRAKSPSYAAASKLDVDVEDFIEKGQSYGEFKKRLDKLKEDKKLTYSDFVQMVRDDMMAGSSPDGKPSDEQVRKRAKSYYNDYLQGASVDDLFEATKKEYNALLDKEYELTKAYSKDKTDANWKKLSDIRKKGKKLEKELEDQGLLEASKEEENEFHKELDKLVHKTFGHSSNEKKEMEEYNTGLYYDPSKEKYAVKAKQASKSGLEKVRDFVKKVMKEEEITVDDATEFKINLKHLLDKHVVKGEALSDFEEEDVNYDELYSDYKYKVNEAKPKKGHGEKISKEVFAKLKGKTISYKGADYKVVDSDEAVLTLKDEDGKSKTINLRQFNVSGMIDEIMETIELGKNLNEELCAKGKAYIKKRQAAGEKSSAYLSGRAVKVCKGQMKG